MYLKEIKVHVEDSSWNASYLFAFSPEVKCSVYTAVFIFKLLLNNKSGNTFFLRIGSYYLHPLQLQKL